jgi:polar amino acid transport system substrate-binding protein
LRVDLEVDVMPTEDILPAVNRGSADLGFPLLPVTETLARRNTLTNPYWVSHQRLAVRSGGGIEDARDLDGKRACEARSEDVDVPLEVVSPDISIVVAPLPSSRCERLLASEAVDAVTGADAYLGSIAADDPGVEIVGEQLSTYAFSAAAPQGDTDLSAWVEAELAEAISEGRWREWFEDTMGEVEGLGGPVAPELTLEEAATLFPKGV